jgi:hypothetical protein
MLKANPDLNILFEDGICFLFAIQDDNLDLLDMLIDYYQKNHLSKFKEGTTDYNIEKFKLRDIFIDIYERLLPEDISDRIKERIDKYCGYSLEDRMYNDDSDGQIEDFSEDEFEDMEEYIDTNDPEPSYFSDSSPLPEETFGSSSSVSTSSEEALKEPNKDLLGHIEQIHINDG